MLECRTARFLALLQLAFVERDCATVQSVPNTCRHGGRSSLRITILWVLLHHEKTRKFLRDGPLSVMPRDASVKWAWWLGHAE